MYLAWAVRSSAFEVPFISCKRGSLLYTFRYPFAQR